MSSILKALKRVEETVLVEEAAQHPPSTGRRLSPRRTWPPAGWLSDRKTACLVSLVVVLGVAGAVYYWWPATSASPPDDGTEREIRAQLPPRPLDTPPPAPVRTVRPRPGTTPPPSSEPDSDELEDSPRISPPSPVQAPPPTSRVRPREAPAAPSPDARASPSRSPVSSPDRKDGGRPGLTKAAEDSPSRLDESKLLVMAIAWATDPARRLAVVNGHIVKEGESVEGFSIMQIRKDDIIVNDGNRSWRVELNLKRQP